MRNTFRIRFPLKGVRYRSAKFTNVWLVFLFVLPSLVEAPGGNARLSMEIEETLHNATEMWAVAFLRKITFLRIALPLLSDLSHGGYLCFYRWRLARATGDVRVGETVLANNWGGQHSVDLETGVAR